jgi:hypothetical protein
LTECIFNRSTCLAAALLLLLLLLLPQANERRLRQKQADATSAKEQVCKSCKT